MSWLQSTRCAHNVCCATLACAPPSVASAHHPSVIRRLQVCFAEETQSACLPSMIMSPLRPPSSGRASPVVTPQTDRPARERERQSSTASRLPASARQADYSRRNSRLPEIAPSSATTNFYIPFHQLEFHEKVSSGRFRWRGLWAKKCLFKRRIILIECSWGWIQPTCRASSVVAGWERRLPSRFSLDGW